MTSPLSYFHSRRETVCGFVSKHFTWPGTLYLHSAAFGWDILRAPLNVLLSPILVLTRIVAYACRRADLVCAADWLMRRRILLRTSVARRVEILIAKDLLDLPWEARNATRGSDGISKAILAAPQIREMIRQRGTAGEIDALGQRISAAISEYAGARTAVAEMTTTFCILAIGALVFQALTPGMISMAPDVAEVLALRAAIEAFPLGQTIGGMWYGLFGATTSPWLETMAVAGLVMLGSVFAAFTGILADPLQSYLGIHRRRLNRLLDTIEAEFDGRGSKPFVTREHFYARLLDLWDAVASVFRLFRN